MTTTTQPAVTQSEFAKLIGRDKSHVTRLKQAGRLVLTVDGLVDVDKSRALIASGADPSRADAVAARDAAVWSAPLAPASPTEALIKNTFQKSKALNEKYKALTAKAEYERLIGKLVDADESRLFAADLAATFRAALEILSDRMSPELVALTDIEATRALLVENFEQTLTDISDKIKQWGAAP